MIETGFRFLVIAENPQYKSGRVDLLGVANQLFISSIPTTLSLYAVLGVVAIPEQSGKRVALTFWRLGSDGSRQSVPGWTGTHVDLPGGLGPIVCPYKVELPIEEPGIYGFDAIDCDALFGPRNERLATYIFSVESA